MVARRNFIKDLGRILFWFPLRWLINILPFTAIYWLGGGLGELDYILSGNKRRNKMIKNISVVFNSNEKEVKKIIRSNLKNYMRNTLEFIKYPQLTAKKINDILTIDGIGILDQELVKGKGIILTTAHFGAKQLLQIALGLRGYKVNQIHYHMDDTELTFIQKQISQRHRKKIEEKIPAKFISKNGFFRSAFECLKENQILIIAADGTALPGHMNRGYGQFYFFGKKVLFPSNIPSLSIRTGASIVPTFVIRDGRKHKIIIEQPLKFNSQSHIDSKWEFIDILEKYIKQYPDHWEFWEEFEEGRLIVKSDKEHKNEIFQ